MQIEITKEEKQLIINALNFIDNHKMDVVKQNSGILSDEERSAILASATKYAATANKFEQLKNNQK